MGLDVRLSLALALSTIQVTVRFSSVSPQFLGRTPWGRARGLPPLIPYHQPHERTCGSTAVYSTPMPRRHYTFTNIHVFSGIRTQALRHSSKIKTSITSNDSIANLWDHVQFRV
ncbi:hypothetical protein TNCV_2340611 [Trichonephila clavipes]|nr:hypothetical protein TNCV_2340611 [Trichonephila clavipes]